MWLLLSSGDRWAKLFEANDHVALTPGWPDDRSTRHPSGVPPLPITALKSSSPVLRNPAHRNRAVPLTFEQFRPSACPRRRCSRRPRRRSPRSVAGPDVFALDELGRITLAARGHTRTVVTDDTAGPYAAVPGDALIAGNDAVNAATTYRQWLADVTWSRGSVPG